ncbi:hypothetical protein PORCAN_485 [Porphyromonas crevioricanis JCM 13913]|nr:hypothetical protein PORCAN_485 [Porphyromonas crevioricanis JCM 13913]
MRTAINPQLRSYEAPRRGARRHVLDSIDAHSTEDNRSLCQHVCL